MTTLTVSPARSGLGGRVRVPGDKSISHRALLLAARAEGTSSITGLSAGADVQATLAAIGAFGAIAQDTGGGLTVEGGPARLHEPHRVIDVGNSGTGIRLMAGWASALDGLSVLEGDSSVAGRPMGRVVDPLRLMGATVDGRDQGRFPPLVIRGGHLHGIDYTPPVASAQVKGALLLAGLGASGPTTVREAVPTRPHTEEMLAQCGAAVEVRDGSVTVHPGPLQPTHFAVPGDPSQAAFWIVAALVTPNSELEIEPVYLGPGRAGFLDVLRRMGADVEVVDYDDSTRCGRLVARHCDLRSTEVGGEEVPGLIDEIPILAVAAGFARGATTFRDAAELHHKESDRVVTTVAALQAIGVGAEEAPDGLVVEGTEGRPPSGGTVDSAHDHRIAMASAVAALAASGPVHISGWESVATSYPGFEEELERCQNHA